LHNADALDLHAMTTLRLLAETTCASRTRTLLSLSALALACGLLTGTAAAQERLQPAGWDDGVRLTDAVDTNPDPDVVEVALEARIARVEIAPGQFVEAWTYNGTVAVALVSAHPPSLGAPGAELRRFATRRPRSTASHRSCSAS
jgi:hypothetical protein